MLDRRDLFQYRYDGIEGLLYIILITRQLGVDILATQRMPGKRHPAATADGLYVVTTAVAFPRNRLPGHRGLHRNRARPAQGSRTGSPVSLLMLSSRA
jgi:hypothetical protein